ncbi:hypothetical protein [Marinitoga lauensis]|uniref:hypothetical protein n=1 Tax=Marinitoga lauensis TaxID=2201189 RepID=UPI001012698F|nr:hypothetical protein [Marinitoga lauensis]
MELIVEAYSKTTTVVEFMNEIVQKMKKKFGITISFIEHTVPTKKGLIKVGDRYFEIKYDYEYDEDIVEKIKVFFEKILLIKHAEELNKVLENYSDLAKETLLMNFVSWDLIQEINSALTSLNLITFFFEEQHPDMANEIKKSIERIKNAVLKYKLRFYNDDSIEVIDLKDVLKEIEKKIVFLEPNIQFKISFEAEALIYGSRKIFLNALLNVIVMTLKHLSFNKKNEFDIHLYLKEKYYILEIFCSLRSCQINSDDFERSIKISKTMLENYHIVFDYYCENDGNITFKLKIPAKSE